MSIPGLSYLRGYLSNEPEMALIEAIDAQAWRTDLKRRVQHYGYRYDYTARSVYRSMYLGPLPDWSQLVAQQLTLDGHMTTIPDQLIVNEYEPGQGISSHTDCVPCFGPTICSLTLGSGCTMDLTDGTTIESLYLERSS
jgi:alkylated DNA repair dioxygenase AlkB